MLVFKCIKYPYLMTINKSIKKNNSYLDKLKNKY